MSYGTYATGLSPAAGWYPDPYDPALLRWWDGYRWTAYVAPVPVAPPRRRGIGGVFGALGAALLALLLVGGVTSGWGIDLRTGSAGWDAGAATGIVPPGSPVQAALESTVIVESGCGRGCFSVGAGVAVEPDLILTAAHVVDETNAPTIRTFDGRFERTTVVARDDRRDLALLQVAGGHGLPLVPIRSEEPRIGEPAYAIGAPSGTIRLSSGMVRDITWSPDDVEWVETNADIDQGNSGGPLLDADGRLLGIVVTENADDDTQGWATSAAEARAFLG
jgi:S1-C subfamily serine protease